MSWNARWLRAGAALILALAPGCDDGTAPGTADVAGVWDFTAQRDDPIGHITCADTGSFTFVAVGGGVAGLAEEVGTCVSPLGSFHYMLADSIRQGAVSGTTLTFILTTTTGNLALCSDTAVMAQAPVATLTGSATCGDAHVTFHAQRAAAVASLNVTPGSASAIVGGTLSLTAELRAASGARVFGRAVSWATDSALVATVSPQGLVTAVGAGPATISASTGGLTGSASITVLAPANLISAGAGDARSCALTAAGAARCWGLSPGGGSTPTPIAGGLTFVSLTVGHNFACGLVTGGAAYCFGANDSGQLGNSTRIAAPAPVAVAGGLAFRALSAGGRHACGITVVGDAWCWGANAGGQLGNGTTTSSTVPVLVSGGINFFTITSGGSHTCAIRGVDSLAFCWGDNTFGQLGDSTTTKRLVPTRIAFAGTLAPLSAGAAHTCGKALLQGMYCWGSNSGGQLGTGNRLDSHYPVPVSGGQAFIAVSAGSIHSCAISTVGAAWCWGTNSWGQLGDGTTTSSDVPVPVSGGLRFVQLSAGLYSYSDEAINWTTAGHTCGVTTGAGGATWCGA